MRTCFELRATVITLAHSRLVGFHGEVNDGTNSEREARIKVSCWIFTCYIV